jgi:hypothetical protein
MGRIDSAGAMGRPTGLNTRNTRELIACPAMIVTGDIVYVSSDAAIRHCWADGEPAETTARARIGLSNACGQPPSTSIGLCYRHGRDVLGEDWVRENHGKAEEF